MGTDGNAIAGASEPSSVTGDRFEDRIPTAEPMVPLPTPEAVVVTRRKPRHVLAPVGEPIAARSRDYEKKDDVGVRLTCLT